jgi:poly-gamma-glutamate synthesis protein (capsule biosynthesis protein)
MLLAVGVARAEPESTATTARAAAFLAKPRSVTIAVVGDILFGRYLRSSKRYRRVAATDDPFADVAPVLSKADVTFGNVECPIMAEPKEFETLRSLTFRCEPEDADTLVGAGFDVVSVANNHTMNLGSRGAGESKRHLEAAGLSSVGAGASEDEAFEPAVVEVNGRRIAFLGYTTWTNGRKPVGDDGAVAYVSRRKMRERLAERVRAARDELKPDFLVVSVHWGWEGDDHPRDEQERVAHAAIDAGADLIVGHHPHVMQDVEQYEGGVIAYSLGNFLFDNPALGQRRTVILEATFEGGGEDRKVSDVTLHPVVIDRDLNKRSSVPKLATGKDYRAWRRVLKKLAPGAAIAPDPTR